MDKLAVVHTIRVGCGIDSGNPQASEISLAGAPIAIGKIQRPRHCFMCDAKQLAAWAGKALG